MSLKERLLKEQREQLREQDEHLNRLDVSGIQPLRATITTISGEVDEQNLMLDDLELGVSK